MSSLVQASFVATGQVQSLDSVRTHALPSDALIFASPSLVTPTNQNPGSYIVNDQVSGATPTINGSVPAVTASPFADLYKEGSVFINGVAANYISTALTGYTMSQGISMEMFVNYQNFTNSTYTIGFMAASAATYNFTLGVNGSAAPIVTWTGGTLVSSVTVSANTWNHLACSWDGTTLRLYVNGALGNSTTSFTPPTLAQNFLVGRANSLTCTAYVTDVRIVTNPAVYVASTLTVPSAPLSPAAAGTTNFMLRIGQNSPTIQNGALTFDRGLKQFMNFGPQTFNIATRGFTALFRYTWNGTAASYERILSFTTTNNSGTLLGPTLDRVVATNALGIYYYTGSGSFVNLVNTTTILNQGTTYVVAFVYNPSISSGTGTFWINGVYNSTATGLNSTITADILCPYTIVGADQIGTQNGNFTSNTFAIYNRALSNVEIYNSYLALNTVPATPQQKTLEIGDINGTPALSVAGDGKVTVQSIGLTSNVLPWPPAAMTGYDTVINGGVYKARASSENIYGNYPWQAFDKSISTNWVSLGTYNTSIPYNYTGSATTTDTNGTVYTGEWLQIQLPVTILLSSYSIAPNSPANQAPYKFVVLGSRDGVNWTLVDSRSSVSSWTVGSYTLFTVTQQTQSYTYYRLSSSFVAGNGGLAGFVEWTLYGTADTSPTLTIAPATTFNTSVATPSLTGVAGSAFVPQDFSCSGLNIPAYVVSNTATTANTVAYSNFGPFAGEGSLYFPGGTGAQGAFVYFPPSTVPQLNFTLNASTCSIEFWFFPTKPGGAQSIVAHAPFVAAAGYDWTMYIGTNNKLGFYAPAGGNPESAATVNYGAWNHAAFCFTGGNVYLSLNGVTTSAATAPTNTSTYVFVIGQERAAAGTYTFSGYISNFRVVQGQALYTTSFTPPTQSLQPIQGTTQSGLPYGTVLLLRNAPAPGRIQTTKFSGANSGTVLSFPPAAMTTYATALASGYGQGTYVASASSEASTRLIYLAFDKSASTFWQVSGSPYTLNTPYSGSVATVDANGTSYGGEWLQIQKPVSTVLSSYALASDSTNAPSKWFILGSRDGTNWSLVDQQTGASSWTTGTYKTYSVNSSQSFTYYRIIINIATGSSGVQPTIYEWTLNGSIESVNVTADGRLGVGVTNPARALEVAGDVVCAGTLSAGNPLMFRNRIINGDMRIAQRGTSSSAANYSSIDRWNMNINGGNITLATSSSVPPGQGFSNSSSLTINTTIAGGTSGAWYMNQKIEGYNVSDFGIGTATGQPFTASFWLQSSLAGTLSIFFQNSAEDRSYVTSITVGAVNSWTKYTITVPPVASGTWYNNNLTGITMGFGFYSIYNTGTPSTWVNSGAYWLTTATNYMVSGTTINITGVQLEKGSVATPFETRPFATELALCQRYYQVFGPGNTSGYNRFGAGHAPDTTHGLVIIPFQVNMRAASTTFSNSAPNTFQLNSGAAAPVATNISTSDTSPTSAQLYVTVASGLTAGYGVICIGNGTTTAYVGFGAEL